MTGEHELGEHILYGILAFWFLAMAFVNAIEDPSENLFLLVLSIFLVVGLYIVFFWL